MDKIAICITTFNNDEGLMATVNSILDVYQENWTVLIGDKNNIENYSDEKRIFYETACAKAHTVNPKNDRIKVHTLLNYSLINSKYELVKLAHSLGINYCLMASDSIKFTKSMEEINKLLPYFKKYNLIGIDTIQSNSTYNYNEGKLEMGQEGISFISIKTHCSTCDPRKIIIWNCDCVRPFYLATTESLLSIKGKSGLDFFWEYKQKGYKVGFTNFCKGTNL